MKTLRTSLAALELALIVPATLFMAALFLRSIQPVQFEPAYTAQRIVDWYAARTHLGLWVFLIALPLAVLLIGAVTLVRAWRSNAAFRAAAAVCAQAIRRHFAVLVVALATATSAGILCIVVMHLLTD